MVALVAVLGAALAGAATSIQKVGYQAAVTTLNDGSAAEQAFIFSGLAKGRDLTRWQTGQALRKTLEAATGPGAPTESVSGSTAVAPARARWCHLHRPEHPKAA
jgi:hypothetical protein